MDDLKPPAAEALERALQVLLESIEGNSDQGSNQHRLMADPAFLGTMLKRHRALDLARKALSKEAKARMTDLARQRNRLVPINKLPFELTASILLQSLVLEDHEHLVRLHELSWVQVSWWNIIKSHPWFWNTIFAGGSGQEIVKLKLRKSGAVPLDIVCDEEASENRVRRHINLLEDHRDRIRSFIYGHDLDLIQDFIRRPLPQLEEMALVPKEYSIPSLQFLGGPHLRHLEVNSIPLEWDGPMDLHHLRVLAIGGNDFDDMPLETFAVALASCVRLEKLYIRSGYASPGKLPPSIDPIHLPRLQSLEFNEVPSDVIVPLLAAIHADSLSEFCVNYCDRSDDCIQTAQGLVFSDHPPPSLASLLTNPTNQAQSIEILIQCNTLKLEGKFLNPKAQFFVELSEVLDWMARFNQTRTYSLSECGVPNNVRIWDNHGQDQTSWLRVGFVPALNVRVLRLDCGLRVAAHAIRQLTTDAVDEWHCPSLEAIHLYLDPKKWFSTPKRDWNALAEALELMIEERSSVEAHAAGVTQHTIYACGRSITEAGKVQALIDEGFSKPFKI